MEFVSNDFLGTPAWFWPACFWIAFISLVSVRLAFDLGILNKHDRELGAAESLKLSVSTSQWCWPSVCGSDGQWAPSRAWSASRAMPLKALSTDNVFVISLGMTVALLAGGISYSLWRSRAGRPQSAG